MFLPLTVTVLLLEPPLDWDWLWPLAEEEAAGEVFCWFSGWEAWPLTRTEDTFVSGRVI
jgi:hypothetical protein